MEKRSRLFLAFVGDDFTGSTDALEMVARAGLRVELFLRPPSSEELKQRPDLDAIGVAGATRSFSPTRMDEALRPLFHALSSLRPRHVQYKVCSTFDSSPTVGSIGRAIDIGSEVFSSGWVPLVVGAPSLGRYCLFGNLFARLGIGSNGEIFRLDRHPAMKRHPVTPSDESDLRIHLSRQTKKRIALLDILDLRIDAGNALARLVDTNAEVVLFDTLDEDQLRGIGLLLEKNVTDDRSVFSVGSSGLTFALCSRWTEREGEKRTAWASANAVERCLIVSGSCSPVTAGQIDWAERNGFQMVLVDPASLDESEVNRRTLAALAKGHTVVYSSRGQAAPPVSSEKLGGLLGRVARCAVENASVRRIAVAGGDTSSYAGVALGASSLSMTAPLAPGAPLCRVHSPDRRVDGVEINFKGGQVGAPDYFGAIVRGRL